MCSFLLATDARPDQVFLEVRATGGRLTAFLRAPECTAKPTSFDRVPLLQALSMAKLLAEVLRTDVVVADRFGVWHDWLLEWASRPDWDTPDNADCPVDAHGGSDMYAGFPGMRTLHAPAL